MWHVEFWDFGTLPRIHRMWTFFFFYLPLLLSLSLSPLSLLSLSLFFFLRAGVSYISPVSPGEGDWRTEREGLGLKHPAVFDSHWNSLKPTWNKWSERIRHLRSKSPFFFFFFFFLTYCKLLFGTVESWLWPTFLKPLSVPWSFLEVFHSGSFSWMFELHVPSSVEYRLFAWQTRGAKWCSVVLKVLSALLQIQLFQTEHTVFFTLLHFGCDSFKHLLTSDNDQAWRKEYKCMNFYLFF